MRLLSATPSVALSAIALCLCCCSSGSRATKPALARFPIGIYGVSHPNQLARLKSAGFDTFHCGEDFPLLESLASEAKRQGMRMVVYPDKVPPAQRPTTRNWPLEAWYLADEPDVQRLSSATMRALSQDTSSWDPIRPQTFVIGQGSPAKLYAGIGDVLMLDWYPIPHKPADSLAEHLDIARNSLPVGKPLWAVVQAYDWADEVKDPVKLRGLRFPTHSEIRFMSYLSVVHGATGLFYFTLIKKGQTLFDYPELWQAVSRVSREIKAMQPIFERGTRMVLPFPPDPDGPEARAWRYHGRDYVVILNRKANAYQRVPKELLDRKWRPLFELRRDPKELLLEMRGGFYLRPYQVLVLEGRLRFFR